MSKYIDADQLDKKFNEILDNPKEYDKPIHDMLREFYFAPTEDVEPVRHGRWEDFEEHSWSVNLTRRCQICGWLVNYTQSQVFTYCPNCGAIMDGKEQENE